MRANRLFGDSVVWVVAAGIAPIVMARAIVGASAPTSWIGFACVAVITFAGGYLTAAHRTPATRARKSH
jgi:hypothetical protein